MRVVIFAPTTMLCLCGDCALQQLPHNLLSGAERKGHAWDIDHGRLIVVDRSAEQPCTACQQEALPPDETVEYLILHVYRLVKFLKAYRYLTAYGGILVDEAMNLISERFPGETAAIRADIERLVGD